jgi:hypothetical protein
MMDESGKRAGNAVKPFGRCGEKGFADMSIFAKPLAL